MDSSTEANERFDNTYLWGDAPSLFDPEEASCACADREGFPDLRSDRCGHLISLLQQSSAPATNFVVEVCRENKAQIYSSRQTLAAVSRAHLPPTSAPHRDNKWVNSPQGDLAVDCTQCPNQQRQRPTLSLLWRLSTAGLPRTHPTLEGTELSPHRDKYTLWVLICLPRTQCFCQPCHLGT